MNIRDKLERLDSQPPPDPTSGEAGAEWITGLQNELQLTVLREDHSFILLKENTYPLYREPFFAHLRDRGFTIRPLEQLIGELPGGAPTLREALFFDTETTGLAGGTGTYAFLIGTGHLELDHLVVRQYLLPDFSHEWLMLKHLDQVLHGFRFTVSFNGKSFDIPLLKNRFVLNRMENLLESMAHVDLLHAVRRIWRHRLPACDLQSLERHILRKERIGDIPGEYIPHIYFEFIRKREALLLRDVLEHNFHDIVSMMLLTILLAGICEAPQVHLHYPEDRFCLARHLIKQKQYEPAIVLLDSVLAMPGAVSREMRNQAKFLLSMCHKKNGNAESSRQHLNEMIEAQVLLPHIVEELAKFYEHEDKDYACAREIIEKGIAYLEMVRQMDPKSALLPHLPLLKHRLRRVRRKMDLK